MRAMCHIIEDMHDDVIIMMSRDVIDHNFGEA